MKLLAEVLAVCVLGTLAFTANSHAAATKVTDPRKCTIASTPANCARGAATLVARKALQKRVGGKYLWQGTTRTTSAGSLLKWRVWFADQFPQLPPSGYVAVTYRATSTGWHVYTSIVAAP